MNFLVSLWRQRNYRIAAIVTLVAVVWLLSGLLSGGNESARGSAPVASTQRPTAEAITVKARRLEAQPYITRVVVNSRTEANRSVQVRAELDGVIAALPVAEGQRVAAGDVICEVAAEDRPEKLARARATLRKAELDYAGAKKLQGRGLQSEAAMAQQEVALANARAELKRAQVDVKNLQIRAPFDGLVNSRAVELGDFIRRGEECATVLDLDPMLIVGEVSESQVGRLKPGGQASAQLQQGQLIEGHLRYVSQQAHPVTRAYRVEVAVPNAEGALRSGISARMALPTGEVLAHRINSSLLTLDDRGQLGVRTLDAEHRVRFVNVELVSDENAGVWVTGLAPRPLLITVGQEYVSEGEQVMVEFEASAGDLPAPAAGLDTTDKAALLSGTSLIEPTADVATQQVDAKAQEPQQ
ncbi:efflux RND transporter periplasmic adaptor subunit [Microbulbifer hydrolyticus]|uniref:Efflux RND transporter periplasmic adaptor subunit n=1 Tax=Microbulbifer hydrolyticus TaxID=48074 RepID=A0A6P1TC87_9GAMM|nr:efflux RND transporter periplasmic adaptor subunit [Microbulbifer hydrolyticus]MBB5212912.1 multidrug efflux system membrane fusion protein [Microbulbifer hydrolyticus]QHQ38302.1 efflux RND transporter periplasmic adaptor subunit [Microbulbifer hydrolyticus]